MPEKAYDINSIQSLDFREGVRTRIQMYLGSDDIEGTYQALKEIINNSTDEALAGYGKRIEIQLYPKTNGIRVRDYGRGVPFGIRADGENVLVSIFTKSHTGGKFSHDAYKNASGLNGIGASCVCLSSSYFEVTTIRKEGTAQAKFKQGILDNYTEHKSSKKADYGTIIYFEPDPVVFCNGKIGYDYNKICQDIQDISYLYPGIEFIVSNTEDVSLTKTFCAKNGIEDFVTTQVKKPLHKHIITGSATDGTDSVEIAFQWGVRNETAYVFVNGLRCPEGGSPITGARSAITKTFNTLAEAAFEGEYIRKNLFYVINCKVENPSFANQTKSKVNNASLRTLASNAFSTALKEMSTTYPTEFNAVVDMLTKIEKAEAAATRAREAIMNHEKEMATAAKKKVIDSDKLLEARKLGDDAMLVLVEGESAGGSVANGRQKAPGGEKVGILKLRGKAINALANPIDKVLENEEVKLLLQALGITYGQKYNSRKLRYGKIAICSDADFDGSHIGLLVMAIIQKLCPEFIQEGRLYWLKAPVCKLESKGKTYYYYNEEEVENRKESGEMTFFKGIGQMQKKDLQESLFSPSNQHLEQLTPTEDGVEALLELMGEDVEPRKDYVQGIDFGGFKL